MNLFRLITLSLAILLSFTAAAQEMKPDRRTNHLGMVFVRVPETRVWFSIWETRIQDYAAFVSEGHWGRLWPERPHFEQETNHPVVNVTWDDAKGFCIWLTQKERSVGLLTTNEVFRLPTDLEWSKAVGLPAEKGSTAEKRPAITGHYPWGKFARKELSGAKGAVITIPEDIAKEAGNFMGKRDGFEFTSPVGHYKPNALGIYDLGGNAWEWIIDIADDGRRNMLRGGSWANPPLASGIRDFTLPDNKIANVGFRCVFTDSVAVP